MALRWTLLCSLGLLWPFKASALHVIVDEKVFEDNVQAFASGQATGDQQSVRDSLVSAADAQLEVRLRGLIVADHISCIALRRMGGWVGPGIALAAACTHMSTPGRHGAASGRPAPAHFAQLLRKSVQRS